MSTSHSYDELINGWHGRSVFGLVDLDALRGNIAVLRHIVGPDVRLMAVVKANAYGHGAVPIAKEAMVAGADALAVATVDEAAQLRAAGIDAELLVLGAIGLAEIGRAIILKLGLVSANPDFLKAIASEAKYLGLKEPVQIHLKIDSGMRRFGTMPSDAVELAKAIASHPELKLAGVMSHFAAADDAVESSAFAQADEVDCCLAALAKAGIEVPLVHLANSAATLRFPELYRGQVRVGIALYGLRPDITLPLPEGMRPILSIYGRVSRVVELQPGDTVGYGRTWTAERTQRAGLIPLGYGDGYRRALSSTGWMVSGEHRLPVLGRVSMDQTMIGLPDEGIGLGDVVRVVGDGGPGLDELGVLAGTISYEMATGLASRLTKLYVRGGELVGIGDLAGYREV